MEETVIKRVFAWLAVLILLLGASLPAQAEDAADAKARTTATLKLRKEPDTSAKVLDTYKKDTAVTILEWGETWCHVQVGKRTGYMMTEYLSIPEGAMPAQKENQAEEKTAESAAPEKTLTAPGRTDFEPVSGEPLCDPAYLLDEGMEPVLTSTTYQSQNVYINISSHWVDHGSDRADVYVADIYVRSLDCFQRGLAGQWKKNTAKITAISEKYGAILSMTSDSAENLDMGWVIMNGEVLRKTKNRKRDLCVLYTNGEMAVIPAGELVHDQIAALAENGDIWQTFLFGPALLDSEGRAMTEFNSTVGVHNPRSIIGYYEPGHYCFVQVDGRGTQSRVSPGRTNKGLTLTQVSQFMEELGCTAAYNLDGGQSSVMYFNGGVFSTPQNGGRKLGDVVMIVEPKSIGD